MHYYTPELALGYFLPKQTQLEDKFGGYPWGLPQEKWPICESCENPITFFAQFQHHPNRLNLGKENRILFIFSCQNPECETWDIDYGTNAVVILDEQELTHGLTKPPEIPQPQQFDPFFELLPEARVLEWKVNEELLPDDERWKCFDKEEWSKHGWDLLDQIANVTKLGGAPSWLEGPESPGFPYQFAGQFEGYLTLRGPINHPNAIRKTQNITYQKDGHTYHDISTYYELHTDEGILRINVSENETYSINFFAGYLSFLFVNPDPVKPTGKFYIHPY